MADPEPGPGRVAPRPAGATLHEFRNVVFALSALVDGLNARAGSLPEVQRYLPHLREEVARLGRLGMPAAATPPAAPVPVSDLADVLRSVERRLRPVAEERGVRLVSVTEGHKFEVALDPALGEDALALLLDGLILAAARGQEVRVELTQVEGSGVCLAAACDAPEADAGAPAPGAMLAKRVLEAGGGSYCRNGSGSGAGFELRFPLVG